METDYFRNENAMDIGASLNYDLMHVNLEVFPENGRDVSLSSNCDLDIFKPKEVLAKNEVCASFENQSVFEKQMPNNGDTQKNNVNFCNTESVNESAGLYTHVKSENSVLDFNENDKSVTNKLSSSSSSVESFFEGKNVIEMDNEQKNMNKISVLENSGNGKIGLELPNVEETESIVLYERRNENEMEEIHNSCVNENSLSLCTDQKFSFNPESDLSESFHSNKGSFSNENNLILKKNELKVPNSSEFITIYTNEKFDKVEDKGTGGKIISVGMNQGQQSELSHESGGSESSFIRNFGNLNLMEVDNLSNINEVDGENKDTNIISDPLGCIDTSNKDLEITAEESKTINDLSCKNESLDKISLEPSTESCKQKYIGETERLHGKIGSDCNKAEAVDVLNHTVEESGMSSNENDRFNEDNEVQDLNTTKPTALVTNTFENVKNNSLEFEETKVIRVSASIPPLSFLARKVLQNNPSENEKYSLEVKKEDILCNEEPVLQSFTDKFNHLEQKPSSDIKNKQVPRGKLKVSLMSRKRHENSSCRTKTRSLRKSRASSNTSKIAQKSHLKGKGERTFEMKDVITRRSRITRRSTFMENPYKGSTYCLNKENVNVLPKPSRSSRSHLERVSVASNPWRNEKKRTNDEAFQRPMTRSRALNPFFHEPASKCKKFSSDLKVNSLTNTKKTMALRGDLITEPEKFSCKKVTTESVRSAGNVKSMNSIQNSSLKKNKIERTSCMKNLRKSTRPKPICKVFVDMCVEEEDHDMFIKENNLSDDKEIFQNPFHKAPCKGKELRSGSQKGFKNKLNQNINSRSFGELRDCFVRIERKPVIDRLLPAKRPSSSFDPKICELCEPKRAFLSKTALVNHLNESHISSSYNTVGKIVSTDSDIQEDISSRERSLELHEGNTQKVDRKVRWKDEEIAPDLLTQEKNSANSKISSKKDMTGDEANNLKLSAKHFCEICSRRFLSGPGLISHKRTHKLLPKAEFSVFVKEVDPLSIEPFDKSEARQEFDSEFSVHTKTDVENGNIILRFRREKSPRK